MITYIYPPVSLDLIKNAVTKSITVILLIMVLNYTVIDYITLSAYIMGGFLTFLLILSGMNTIIANIIGIIGSIIINFASNICFTISIAIIIGYIFFKVIIDHYDNTYVEFKIWLVTHVESFLLGYMITDLLVNNSLVLTFTSDNEAVLFTSIKSITVLCYILQTVSKKFRNITIYWICIGLINGIIFPIIVLNY
jgi:hypothetical protein